MTVSVKEENMTPIEKKLKVVFADPPFGRESKGEAVTESPNLGILYIIAYAKKRLPEVEFYYLEPFLSMTNNSFPALISPSLTDAMYATCAPFG